MSLFFFKHLTKSFSSHQTSSFLLDVSLLTFNDSRLIGIIGKSGSGKSTLLNLLTLVDKPDDGIIYFKGYPTCYWKDKEIDYFHNQEIGIIFQHYNLLNEHTVLFNIMLPALISGDNKKRAKKKAVSLLQKISFPKHLYDSKVCNLSGGEKQRVAILRSLINDPSVIFADEPTGALDENNSEKIMQILSEISKNRAVIIVSHNELLLRKYVDELIVIKDGKVAQHYVKKNLEKSNTFIKAKRHRGISLWPLKIVKANFIKRISRNLLCILSLVFGLCASLMIIGFSTGSSDSIDSYCSNQFNYGQLKVYKEKKYEVDNSGISITHQSKASSNELSTYKNILKNYCIEPDLSALIPNVPYITYEENVLNNVLYDPIYSFSKLFINKNLLIKGRFPQDDSLSECVINIKLYEYLKEKFKIEPFKMELRIQSSYENYYSTGNIENPSISDIFVFDKTVKIVGVVNEIDYLSNYKIYYSYSTLEEQLMESPMANLSNYFSDDISWFTYVENSGINDPISSYSNYAFLKDISRTNQIENDIASIKNLVLYSSSLIVETSMKQLMSAANMGLDIFLAIILIGTSLILGIVSFSSYCEDKKKSAILSTLGASKSSILSIYVIESLFIGLLSIIISFVLMNPLSLLINYIVQMSIGLSNVIAVPFNSFLNVPYLLPVIIIFSTLLICFISTVIPISFSKKISLREELKDE